MNGMSPQADRKGQVLVLYFLNHIYDSFGFEKVRISVLEKLLMAIVNIEVQDHEMVLLLKHLETILKVKFLTDNEEFTLIQPVSLEFDNLSPEEISSIQNFSKNEFENYYPKFLIEKGQSNIKIISDLQKNLNARLLFTNPLKKKQDIPEAIVSLLKEANCNIFIVVSYFSSEVVFFSEALRSILKEKKRENDLFDFRILYRQDSSDIRQLILKLKNDLEPIGYHNFYKAFDRQFLANRIYNLKNLHAKAIITENGFILGSANITQPSLVENFEIAILVKNENLTKEITNEFLSVWDKFKFPNVIQ